MQRVMDAVSQGYFWWTSGEVSLEKAERLEQKFQRNYRIHESRLDRIKSKKSGFANARFLMFYRGPQRGILWWLLVTAGDHPAHQLERLKDATKSGQRIEFDGFVLSRQTKAPVEGNPAKPSWTWKFSEQKDEAWRAGIKTTIRQRRDRDFEQMMAALYASPGFNGVRVQIGKMRSFLNAEWRRSRAAGEKPPVLPTKLGYVRRLATTGLTLAQLVDQESSVLKLQMAVEQAEKIAEYRAIPPG